jgi:hypothetical protein
MSERMYQVTGAPIPQDAIGSIQRMQLFFGKRTNLREITPAREPFEWLCPTSQAESAFGVRTPFTHY